MKWPDHSCKILCVFYIISFFQIPSPGDNSTRTAITFDKDDKEKDEIEGPKYTQVVIYDHITRRKT